MILMVVTININVWLLKRVIISWMQKSHGNLANEPGRAQTDLYNV
jgi:hypothetical protein